MKYDNELHHHRCCVQIFQHSCGMLPKFFSNEISCVRACAYVFRITRILNTTVECSGTRSDYF